ncbi:hypothetical protein D8867_07935 [Streptococcus salivarius]|jgi:hypothetical protein|uniref:Uncharacterized protein n=1 Tax=Streptococcus salivarius TaxID=1304 RepID=A0AAX1YA24_STRSL|nr:hypothetical protein [Streptococcus salivarius]MBW4820681.1 hypothetical protein [Streptococcus salivarius]RGW73243.1 hypothetical protein DWV54_05485 [Streptococcus salivarius]RSI55770.1 hypothetical protein D8867_07935 [Streptococcus salivarius]VTY29441.1 Uncharacterised protein [Streptococcus salivarius]
MENNIYYQQKFQNLISVSKSLSIGYGILRYVYLREELNKGVHEFLGEKFKTWDDSISEFLLAKMSNIYESNFTINDIYTLWNNGDVRIYFDKDTIRKKVREFEKNLDNMNQAFFSKQDKDELLKIINETWFGKEYKKISHILFEINKGLTQKYSDRSQDEMLLSLDKKLFLIPFEGIVEMGLELDTSRVIKQENDYYIFKSLEDKRKTLQNLEEQVKQKYNLFIDEFSSKYSLMIYGDLRAPLTNISFEFLSNCRAIIVDFKYKIVKIGEKHYDFDIPVVKTESKAGDKKSKIKQGNYQKVYNSAFVSEFIKFLREDLGKSNRQYRKVRYFDFPTRKEIYDNLLKLKSDKERLIFRVGEYNNKIIASILESVISSCCTTLSKMYELRQIFIIFFGIHYQVTFYKYYSIAEEFPNYIMEKIIFLSGLYFDYTLKNILFESSEEYATKMINLNIQEEHQEQLDLFNSKYNQINYYVKEIYTDRFIPFLKKLNEIEGNGYIELSKLLQILIEGFDEQVGENPSRYEESCLMTKIIRIENSFNKIKERLDDEFYYIETNHGDESMLVKYLENISDKLVKDASRHFNSFMFDDLSNDWTVHSSKGTFYDKFDIEFLKFKSEIISKLGDFIKEKQFSDKDELLLREYLDTLGIRI